jgi:hypothetical protein
LRSCLSGPSVVRGQLAAGSGDPGQPHIWKIDPVANAVTGQVLIPVPDESEFDDIAMGTDGSLWVTCFDIDAVLHIRPS